MGTSRQQGFTVLETILFLGVSGVLVALLIFGAGTSLNAQRYNDAVSSFKNVLQSQYAELSTVRNTRDSTWSCDATAVAIDSGNQFRGQGNCVLVGKYMRIDQDDIHIYTVLAYPKASPTGGLDDIDSLKSNYTLGISTADIQSKYLDWGTEIAWPASGNGSRSPTTPRTIGLFFLRSPDSGAVYTFTSDSIPSDPLSVPISFVTDMLVAGSSSTQGQRSRSLCIVSNGLVTGGTRAVYIDKYASSASAIEVRSNDYNLATSGAGAQQC